MSCICRAAVSFVNNRLNTGDVILDTISETCALAYLDNVSFLSLLSDMEIKYSSVSHNVVYDLAVSAYANFKVNDAVRKFIPRGHVRLSPLGNDSVLIEVFDHTY